MSDALHASALADVLRANLGPWRASSNQVLAAMDEHGHGLADLECSVRVRRRTARGERGMVENVRAPFAQRILSILRGGASERPEVGALLGVAGDDPLIVGWDGAKRIRKLYLNLSDASRERRQRVLGALELPVLSASEELAHVVGLNLTEGARWKLYVQRAADGEPQTGDAALDALAAGQELAGVVIAYDRSPAGKARVRARFLAPRGDLPWASIAEASGASEDALRAALPYAPGLVRSVGRTPGGDWTIYVKPRAARDHLAALEPLACFRAGAHEVGVFVTGRDEVPRAYARTDAHAIGYRIRSGSPARAQVEALMRWVLEMVRRDGSKCDLRAPPAPWERTDA